MPYVLYSTYGDFMFITKLQAVHQGSLMRFFFGDSPKPLLTIFQIGCAPMVLRYTEKCANKQLHTQGQFFKSSAPHIRAYYKYFPKRWTIAQPLKDSMFLGFGETSPTSNARVGPAAPSLLIFHYPTIVFLQLKIIFCVSIQFF